MFARARRHWPDFPPAGMLLHAGVLLGVVYVYMRVMESFGGFSTEFVLHQRIELVLLLYGYALFYFVQKPSPWRGVLAALPLLLTYVVHDVFYFVYGKVFRLINVSEFPELVQILPLGHSIALVAALVLLATLFFSRVDIGRPARIAAWLLPLALVSVAVKAAPAAFSRTFESLAVEIVKYSDGKSVEQNGRLAMLAYREAQRTHALAGLAPYRDRERYDQELAALTRELQGAVQPRNVHLVVLESFLDPRLFTKLRFSSPPTHPAFERLFGNALGLSRSPVFGGATAQAEFEVLCGVPAFERFSSVEFNAFNGAAAHCLPGVLAGLGYRSVATNAYKPNFFNAIAGYAGAGFAESHFPEAYSAARPTYLKLDDPGAEDYAFDRPLFEQNLAFVRAHLLQQPKRPLFNYMLTIYGHTPHLLDPTLRPERIALASPYADDHLQRAVNQFYYRTEAIAEYVDALREIDPDGIVILVSDHVPPLRNGPNTYRALRYLDNREDAYYYNRVAILDRAVAGAPPELRHYDMPALVLDRLTGGAYCRQHACGYAEGAARAPREADEARYLRLMAHAAE